MMTATARQRGNRTAGEELDRMDFGRDMVRKLGSRLTGAPANTGWLAREVDQDNQDSRPDAMERLLANKPRLGQLIWEMRDAGRALRREAATKLYARDGLPIVPDSDGEIAYSAAKVLQVTAQQVPLHLERVSESQGIERIRQELSRYGYPIYAWIQTFSGERTPWLFAWLD